MSLSSVLFVVPSLGGGGAEMNAARLSHPLQKAGVSCTYATFSSQNSYRDKLHPDARMIALASSSSSSSMLRLLRGVPSLARLLRKGAFDAVVPVLEGPALAVALAGPLAWRRVPVVLSVQNAFLRLLRESPRLTDRVLHRVWAAAYGRADAAIALSQGVSRDLATYVPRLAGRIRTVNNVGLMEPPPAHGDRRPAANRARLVACGRLDPVKDYPTMLRAVALLAREREVTLELLGDGPQRAPLEALVTSLGIADKVVFHGFVDRPEAIMDGADVFVLSSLSEGFGNVIVEAMALGIPVVATDCPYGPAEILAGGRYGLLASVGDASALAARIAELLTDTSLGERLSRAGRRRAADFTPEVIGEKFRIALTDLCEASR